MSEEEKDFRSRLKIAHAENKVRIESSAVFASCVSPDYLNDPNCALQLGLAILMGKPIVLLIDHDLTVPPDLLKVAKLVQRVDFKKPEEMDLAVKAITDMLKQERQAARS